LSSLPRPFVFQSSQLGGTLPDPFDRPLEIPSEWKELDLLVSNSLQLAEEGEDGSNRIIKRLILRLCSIDSFLRPTTRIRALGAALNLADSSKERGSPPESVENRVDR
jgi:hypothetical protein